MSVFPQFVQHIRDLGIYVEGYNYEAMYNIMVNNLTNNFIPVQQFIYTYAQVEDLYNLLDELLNPNEVEVIETETNDLNQYNQTNEMDQTDIEEDDWTDDDTEPYNMNTVNILDPNQNIHYYYNIQHVQNEQNHLQNQTNQLIHYLNNFNNLNTI